MSDICFFICCVTVLLCLGSSSPDSYGSSKENDPEIVNSVTTIYKQSKGEIIFLNNHSNLQNIIFSFIRQEENEHKEPSFKTSVGSIVVSSRNPESLSTSEEL